MFVETGSPYYYKAGRWLRGFKPQSALPPIESLVGKYAWAEHGDEEPNGPSLDKGLILELRNPKAEVTLENVKGKITGPDFGGELAAVKETKDEEGVACWLLEVTGEEGDSVWRVYVGECKDDRGLPFIDVRQVSSLRYAFGKQFTIKGAGFTKAEKERINFFPVHHASMSEGRYQYEKRCLTREYEVKSEKVDESTYGTPRYLYEGEMVEGLDSMKTVPPLETLLGTYAWAESGTDGPWGPILKGGITLKVINPNLGAIGKNVGGFLGQLYSGGLILGAKKKKDHVDVEYWEIEVTGEVEDEDYCYSSDDEDGIFWHMYVSKEVDDNGHPFIELTTLDDYSSRGMSGPYGYGKRQVDGQPRVGFTETEMKRIHFRTQGEEREEYRKEQEENKKLREEARQKEIAEKAEKKAKRDMERQQLQSAQSQSSNGQGQSKSARKKEEKRRRAAERLLQQQQAGGYRRNGPAHVQHPLPPVPRTITSSNAAFVRMEQEAVVKNKPMGGVITGQRMTSHPDGNRSMKRPRPNDSDNETTSKRIKREF